MAFYCSDCVTWINSQDANRYGEKYCDYDRKYRAATQKIYDCRGFVWARRAIITKVCEILGIDGTEMFLCFDKAKDDYLRTETLIDYNYVGPVIASKMDKDPEKVALAQNILNGFIIPATARIKTGDYENAFKIYRDMVDLLMFRYGTFLEEHHLNCECKHLIKGIKR